MQYEWIGSESCFYSSTFKPYSHFSIPKVTDIIGNKIQNVTIKFKDRAEIMAEMVDR